MHTEISFEVFSPKSVKAAFDLSNAAQTMAMYGPAFASVTCGTGNGSPDLTDQTLVALNAKINLPLAAHIACSTFDLAQLADRADVHIAKGVKQAVAVRGDNGGAQTTVTELTRMLTDKGIDVMVGAYPETHPMAPSPAACLDALKAKQDAGATAAITQFFFEADTYFRFRDAAVKAGIALDLIPGILPVTNWSATQRMAQQCGTAIAPDVAEAFARAQREDRTNLMATVHTSDLCDALRSGGVDCLHFYTMNRMDVIGNVLRALGHTTTTPVHLAA
ncbi:MAG: methylenetetrahydrofolate reductase [Planktomarina sp.]